MGLAALLMLRTSWPLISALDSCFLLSTVWGIDRGRQTPPWPPPPHPFPDKVGIKGPRRTVAELWAPALGCQTPYTWKQLTTWLRAVTSELPAHPGSLAGSAPGRKPPRSALWTTCHSRGDPERWLESKGSGSGRAHKSSSCARWAGERWGRTSQEMEARAAGAALLGEAPAPARQLPPDLPAGQEDGSQGNGKHKLHTNLAFCCLELSFC